MHQIPSSVKRRKGEISFSTKPARIMQPSAMPLQYAHLNKPSLFKSTNGDSTSCIGSQASKVRRHHSIICSPLWEPDGIVPAPVLKLQALGFVSLSDLLNLPAEKAVTLSQKLANHLLSLMWAFTALSYYKATPANPQHY